MHPNVVVAHLAGVVGCALLGAVLYGGIMYMTLLTGFVVAAILLLLAGVEARTCKMVAWGTFLVNSFIVVVCSATAATAL
jgi:hypothetical protein